MAQEQYFEAKPSAPHEEKQIEAEALGLRLRFVTDAATFSRGHLDEGSRLLLETLPPLEGDVADLGCGWGALGCFLAAKNPQARLTLLDVNERAAALAGRNLALNGLHNAQALAGDGRSALPTGLNTVVTNPPIRAGKAVVYALFAAAHQALTPGGVLYVVIRKQQGAESAQNELATRFAKVERIAREKGFWILRAEKGPALET